MTKKALQQYIARYFQGGVLLITLSGCAVGPDFVAPAGPDSSKYTPKTLAETTHTSNLHLSGQAQQLNATLTIDPYWWRTLGSPGLDDLIGNAYQNSPTLAIASARLTQSSELLAAQAGASLWPQVDLTAGSQRQQISPHAQGQEGDSRLFSLNSYSVGMYYKLDLAGSNRRALESLAARVDYRQYELAAARLDLAGNIATTALTQARLAEQLKTMAELVQMQEEQLKLTSKRVNLGQTAAQELTDLRAQVELTRSELPVLQKQLEQTRHRLAVLAGQEPGANKTPLFRLADFSLPAQLPLTVPSELVRQRPDILAAEALLHEATADYGVAVARLYPQIELSASLGSQALAAGPLFGAGSAVWGLIAQLTQPLFKPGLAAEKRAALAAMDAAAAQYRLVVLEALRDVADALSAIETDVQTWSALEAADQAAQASLQSTKEQYRLGAASYLQWLVARQQAQQIRMGLIAAQTQRLIDTVTLYRAMGHGTTSDDPQ